MEEMIWKKTWQITSGLGEETPNKVVLEKLTEVKDDLRDGLLHFKRNTDNDATNLAKLLKDADQEKLIPFAKQLQGFLDLNAAQTWSILCTYLVNEYRGSPNSLSVYVSNESNKWKLIHDIWNYYSLERMIMLKLVKNMLEYHKEKKHPYHEEYRAVLVEMNLTALKESLMKQLAELMKDDVEIRSMNSYGIVDNHDKPQLMRSRNLREINELIHLIILANHFNPSSSSVKDLKEILSLFKNKSLRHSSHSSHGMDDSLLQNIEFSKVMLALFLIENADPNLKSWEKDVSNVIDELILNNTQTVDCGPLLLAWMIKNLKFLSMDDSLNDALISRNYQQCGNKAVQLEVFRYLHHLVTSKMFINKPLNLLATIVRKTVYNLLGGLCDLFDADGSVSQHEFVFELFTELLATPAIANEFIKEVYNEGNPRGCCSLYNTALELFPVEFIPLTKIVNALALSGVKSCNEFIRSQITSLPVFTEIFTDNKYELQTNQEDCEEDVFILMRDYFPLRKFNYKIPQFTKVVIIDRKNVPFIHFKHNVNYFDVLRNEILEVLLMSAVSVDDSNINRVTQGVIALKNMVGRLKSPSEISESMVHPTEMVFDLLLKFKTVQNPPIELLANCLEVCASLLRFCDKEIIKRLLNLNILPTVSSDPSSNYHDYKHGLNFEPGLVGQYLINFETSKGGKYPFLKAYFHFLKSYTDVKDPNIYSVELPGLVFLLREIFPHCHTFRFESEADLHEIYIFVMEYFFDILQSTDTSGERKILRDITVTSLLNLENGMTLLKFVGMGNPYLQSRMENETNWVAAIHSGLTNIVRLAMTILMQILRQKSEMVKDPEGKRPLSPLETVIYTQPKQRDNLRIIPVVTSYMNNIFNRRLPILSCRLLRRFAIEFQMSLLACLDMEQDLIRMIFLQRLRDELGSNDLKIAILEFVESCLDKQPGLIEAFFDVRYESEMKKTKKLAQYHTEGIPAYMDEYLDTISKEPEKIASPLLSRILSLFHAVWRNGMQSLIVDLIKQESFWPSLCKPFFVPISHKSIRAYSQLFNILGIEVFRQERQPEKNLEQMLEKLFEEATFRKWVNFVFEISDEKSDSDSPEWICRLQSFKDFVVVVMKKQPGVISSKAKGILLNKIVKVLLSVSGQSNDWRPLVTIGELYLILLLNNDEKRHTENDKEDKALFKDVASLMNFLSNAYEDVIPRAREALLGSVIQLLIVFNIDVALYPEVGYGIVQATLSIICHELYRIQNGTSSGSSNSLNLALNVLRKLLLINAEKRFFDWHSISTGFKILYRILSALKKIIQNYEYRKVTTEFLDLLNLLTKATESDEFLFCDVSEYLWLKLLPPKSLLQNPFTGSAEKKGWTIKEWWPIYSKGIELVTSLLRRYEQSFVKEAISFVGIHEEYIMDSIFLVKESLEPSAMKLIKNALELINETAKYHKQWQLDHPQSLVTLMRCVQVLTEYLISLLYRPNLLKMLLDGRQSNQLIDLTTPITSTPELIAAMNSVVETIVVCSKCLLYFSPSLQALICEPKFVPSQFQPLIEIQFGAPSLNESFRQLSFGTLMSAAATFTKCLNLMHYSFNEVPLNFVDETTAKEVTSQDTTLSKTSSTASSVRIHYGKALSVSSYGNQAQTNCNEIWASLDSNLCVLALEQMLTLLLSQSYLALKDTRLSARDKQLIKRELSTELNIFHDFVRKRLGLDAVGTLIRKKHGSVEFKTRSDPPGTSKQDKLPSSVPVRLSQSDLRVNVVRKLHLTALHMRGSTPRKDSKESIAHFENITPIKRADKSKMLDVAGKRLYTNEKEGDVEYLEAAEEVHSGLFQARIVEEDYLHCLSNLFTIVVCHLEN